MNPRALFFCVAATLSCGVPQSGDGNPDGFNPPIGGDPTASGSRLKLQVLAGEDGSRQALGFWDSKLNEACYALRDEKGDLRCFPRTGQASYYADAGCTAPLFSAYGDCQPSRYGLEYVARTGCGPIDSYRAYRLGDAASPATVYYRGVGGICTATPAPAGAKLWAGTRVADSEFVLMTMRTL